MIEEFQKFLVAMARFALGDHRAVQHVKRGEQRGGAVPVVVVGYPLDISEPHRQHWLGTLQRLNLTFLVDAQHQGLVGRVEVKANYVANLFCKEGVGRELNPNRQDRFRDSNEDPGRA